MNRLKVLIIIILLVNTLKGQNNVDNAFKLWEKGNITQVLKICDEILKVSPLDSNILLLKMKTLCVSGKYKESLTFFSSLSGKGSWFKTAVELAVDANIHLKNYKKAWTLIKEYKLVNLFYWKEFADRPFLIEADKTYVFDFFTDSVISSSFWPGIYGFVNGQKVKIRFDTGGTYLIIGKLAAEALHINFTGDYKSWHGSNIVNSWHAIADSLCFVNGLKFRNVPILVMEDLGDNIIFGTNIIENFLTTIDYPNNRFILTPRNRADLYSKHRDMLPQKQTTVPFFMWYDHYMFAKGTFANKENLNLFFDSGLIALTEEDDKLIQAAFTASKESMVKYGFDEIQLDQSKFFPTNYTLEIEGLSQKDILVWYDDNLKKDRYFGGIRIDGLISHAWLKNYTWTIDFEKHEYWLGENE